MTKFKINNKIISTIFVVNEIEYVAFFEPVEFRENTYEFRFSLNKEPYDYNMTNLGNAVLVLSQVEKIVVDFLTQYKHSVYYSAIEDNQKSVYDAISNKYKNQYNFEITDKENIRTYIVTKR